MFAFEEGEVNAKAIPYKGFKERMLISRSEEELGRKIDYDDENVYSFPKRAKKSKYVRRRKHIKVKKYIDSKANRTFENLKCNSCNSRFRIIALEDIQWSICPRCGGANIDKLNDREEHYFEIDLGGI